MDGYAPQLPTLHQLPNIPLMPQIQEAPAQQQQPQPNTAPNGGGWMPGATTVGIVFHGGVILAAEKRVTYGGFIMSKGGKKVFKVTDRIGVACAGLIGDMQILAREMEAQANLYSMDVGRPITVRSASKLMANVLFNRRYAPLITQTIVAGLDEEGANLYVLDLLGSLIPDKYAAVGGGPRAVGNAMACNLFAPIVPCHRVVKSDLTLGGYGAGGLKVKLAFLEREQRGYAEPKFMAVCGDQLRVFPVEFVLRKSFDL